MTMYSRSDEQWKNISPAHGGCGAIHARPKGPDGEPVKMWALTCPGGCEDFLRTDPNWSATISEIPETPDEIKGREDFEKRGAKDRDQVMALAMAKLAGVDLPETMLRPISGLSPHIPAIAGFLVCQQGHDCEPGSKFCAECGSAMRQPQVRACPEGHPVGAAAKFCAECGSSLAAAIEAPPVPAPRREAAKAKRVPLKDMKLADLQAKARDAGLDDAGTRADLLARLRAAA